MISAMDVQVSPVADFKIPLLDLYKLMFVFLEIIKFPCLYLSNLGISCFLVIIKSA